MKAKIFSLLFIVSLVLIGLILVKPKQVNNSADSALPVFNPEEPKNLNPLAIEAMRRKNYPGSEIVIEENLPEGGNYRQYIASYKSEGLKIYGLLTIPEGKKPKNGWPVIIFNHGYIPPDQYVTTQRYEAYVAAFAENGYLVFKPDYRGNGNSEGQPEGAYYSPAYASDALNALSSLKRYKEADPNRIGMWGHSMGGNVTLRDLVVNPQDIKVAVIWGGVVGSYTDLIFNWQRRVAYRPGPTEMALRNRSRQNLIQKYQTPDKNPAFWKTIDPTFYLKDITAPIQLDVGGSDEEVPVDFSRSLRDKLQKIGKTVEYHEYEGSDHNISQSFNLAMKRSLDFFDKYLKKE